MFWRILVRDRRLWLFAALVLLTAVFSRYSVTSQTAIRWVVRGGYWTMLLTVALFGRSVWLTLPEGLRHSRDWRRHASALGLIAVIGAVLLSHERYGFKILADEELLVGTSMSMHLDREVAYPVRATDIQGPFQILQRVLDKRPYFYPFLVSVAHDLTGYRPSNAFYVNTVLGFLFLGLVYALGNRAGANAWAGILLVLLFGGLPLMAQQMTGGGFDLLNLVMILAVLLLAIRHTECRDADSLEAMCLAAILLAYTRYESAALLFPIAAVAVWGWWYERRIVVTWTIVAAPLLLVFALLQNRVFSVNSGAWELAGKPGATTPFGWEYFADNLGHELAFFFDTSGYQPNSPFFAAIGLLVVPFFGLWIARILRNLKAAAPADVAIAAVGLGLFAIWSVLLLYFWGQFDHPLIRRLSLPVHLLMAVAVVVVGRLWLKERGWQWACLAAAAALTTYSLPTMSRRAYAATYTPGLEMEWRTEFLQRYPEKSYLFIDNDATFWISHRIPATPAKEARERQEGLIYHLRNDSFSEMYVLQHFHVDPDTGFQVIEPADDIGPDFELEPFWERRIQTLFIGRISRITAIRQSGAVAARATLVKPATTSNRSRSEIDRAKRAYVDNWLKQLP